MSYHTIVLYPKPQPDTTAAVFLLRKFGEEKLPGVSKAKLEFWSEIPKDKTADQLEQEGYLLIDLGNGRFDHHAYLKDGKPTTCTSELVAKFLGIENDPALKKLLTFAKRDDLEGKGIISQDPLDRAFGLPGIIMNLNKVHGQNLEKVVNLVLEIYGAHYQEELKRTKLMPQEWKQLKSEGKAKELSAKQGGQSLRVIQIQTDNSSLAGFLRAYVHADLVIVRLPSGHVNIITKQSKRLNLAGVAEQLRRKEIAKKGEDIAFTRAEWRQQGRLEEAQEWFYDTVANTIQNGGINPQGIPPTKLSDEEIWEAVNQGLAMV